ncbi:hypothetical protein BpHYR1_033830 [Brachionus plicatilis]|uniref:Uncharacterized protein n=1 Tax=Brachionus plicatilis TaxID=10195 RepID=A0A3M7PU66_BRAPC|nr:hypothetical protein BpHYR1_033830 [Brachionus plicatilis]
MDKLKLRSDQLYFYLSAESLSCGGTKHVLPKIHTAKFSIFYKANIIYKRNILQTNDQEFFLLTIVYNHLNI